MGWPVNLYATVVDLPEPPLPLRSARDRSDPAMIEHLRGLANWIASRGDGEISFRQAHAIEHTWRVHNQLVFEIEPGGESALEAFSTAINAIIFLPDSTLRNPAGDVIIGPDPSGDVPFLPAARDQRAETRERLGARGIDIPDSLPAQPCAAEVELRSLEEVRARIAGLLAVAVCAESRASGSSIPSHEIRARLPGALYTERDQMFLETTDVPIEALPEFTWKYESLAALLWSVRLLDELPFPDAICDVKTVSDLALNQRERAETLRSPAEVCAVLDEHHALHWLAVERDLAGASAPVDRGVLYERRVALSWLIRLGEFGWDEVPTPT